MNEKFTNKAQNALNSALEYAREMGHSYIGSEHLLLGLLSETDSIASKADPRTRSYARRVPQHNREECGRRCIDRRFALRNDTPHQRG